MGLYAKYIFSLANRVQENAINNNIDENCIISAPCSESKCPEDQDCVLDVKGKASCKCPAVCPSGRDPVCGSDGRTYENRCKARKESCEKKKNLSFVSGGCGKINPC